MSRKIYLAGSMGNPAIPDIAKALRGYGHEVFDDWYSPGKDADACWQEYERRRGRGYLDAINGHHAKTVFDFDRKHLLECDTFILALPCGKSGHMELGFMSDKAECHVLFPEEPDRYDVMYRFANGIWTSVDDLIEALRRGSVNVV